MKRIDETIQKEIDDLLNPTVIKTMKTKHDDHPFTVDSSEQSDVDETSDSAVAYQSFWMLEKLCSKDSEFFKTYQQIKSLQLIKSLVEICQTTQQPIKNNLLVMFNTLLTLRFLPIF